MEALNIREIDEIDNAHPLERFRRGIKTDDTFETYTSTLKCILCTALKHVLHGTYEERAAELVKIGKENPIRARNIITQIVTKWGEQAKLDPLDLKYMAPGSIMTNLSPIKKLLDMSDVTLAWKMIHGMCPEMNRGGPSPGWTREDIRKMLLKTNSSMMRAAILVLASSGVRRGGLELKWGDIDPVYLKDGKPVAGRDAPETSGTAEPACTKMRVYRGESEEYVTFMTPEAYKALMEYKADWEEEVSRAPGPEDPVFKRDGSEPIPLRGRDIINKLQVIVKKAGVQKPSKKNAKLCEVPISNGFRRRFNKVMTDTPTDGTLGASRRKEYMMGHHGSVGLDRHYYHSNPMELAAHYLRAVQALTVTGEGLLPIEREKMNEKILKVKAELATMKREEARANVAVQQDADRTATPTDEKIDRLSKIVENVLMRLNSQGGGQ